MTTETVESLTAKVAELEEQNRQLLLACAAKQMALLRFEYDWKRSPQDNDQYEKFGTSIRLCQLAINNRIAREFEDEMAVYRAAMLMAASAAGKDWLEMQLMLADVLDAFPGVHNLETFVHKMIVDGWVHKRTGTNMKTASPDETVSHMGDEVAELIESVDLNSPRSHQIEELGDVYGLVVHMAAHLCISMRELEKVEIAKLKARFDPPPKETEDAVE